MKLKYTRGMINAALAGAFDNVEFETHEIFGLKMPKECPDVPNEILNPRNTWENKESYDEKAEQLAHTFHANFSQFKEYASQQILMGGPVSLEYND